LEVTLLTVHHLPNCERGLSHSFNKPEEFRVYAIDGSGNFADASVDFHPDGRMTKAFEGWIRLAEVQAPGDREILDFHAPAVLVDWQLEVEADGLIKSLGSVSDF